MKRERTLYRKVIVLVCALLLLIISAIPLFSRSTDAKLLGVIFGAFGSGAMLSDLIRDARKANK